MKYILWIWSTAAVSDPTSFTWQQLGGALETRPPVKLKPRTRTLAITCAYLSAYPRVVANRSITPPRQSASFTKSTPCGPGPIRPIIPLLPGIRSRRSIIGQPVQEYSWRFKRLLTYLTRYACGQAQIPSQSTFHLPSFRGSASPLKCVAWTATRPITRVRLWVCNDAPIYGSEQGFQISCRSNSRG
jgi:hypothetical protein